MSKKILVVEDSKNISLMVKMCLEKHGYQVIIAEDGVSAMDIIFSAKPDLILLDVLIPRMDGYLVTEALKRDENTKGLPIIMMSAKAQAEDLKKAQALGADDYLIKPFSPETLMEKVNRYI